MTTYTLKEAAAALRVNETTLRTWLRAAQIVPVRDEDDRRVFRVSVAQLRTVANLHGRAFLPPSPSDASEFVSRAEYDALVSRVEHLEACQCAPDKYRIK